MIARRPRRLTTVLQRNRVSAFLEDYGVWVALGAVALYGAVAAPGFASLSNLKNILRQGAALGIVSLGLTFVITSGGIDLSVGMLMGLITVLGNGIMNGDPSLVAPVVVLALGLGLGVGLFNGGAIVATGIHPLILTLGVLSVLHGGIFVYTDRTVGSSPDNFRALASGHLGPFPVPFLLLIVLTAVSWVLLTRTPFGRYVQALGGNEENARRAGIPINVIKIVTYVISGLSAAIAGLVLAARLGTGYTLAGRGFELNAIVAVVLGGTSLAGGRGNVLGTVAGVYLLATVATLLNLLAVSAYVQQIIKGAIVVAAVAIYTAGRARR